MTRLALAFALGLAGGCVGTATGHLSVTVHASRAPGPPPQDKVETPGVKAGFVWISGSWNHQNGQWTWIEGHWERERAGYRYNRGYWQQRDTGWHWTEGDWVAVGPDAPRQEVRDHREPDREVRDHRAESGHPTAAPPPLRVENHGPAKAGFVWLPGRWDWRSGGWAWIDGHWERARANQVWRPGRWELQGSFYVWIDGTWGNDDRVRDHRK